MNVPIRIMLAFLLAPAAVLADGSLRGRVTDARTGEPVAGTTITLLVSSRAVAANDRGEFVFTSVPVGLHSLRARCVGYSSTTLQAVRVSQDLTTSVELALTPEAVNLEELTVIADRPMVERNATSAVRILTAEQISTLPFRSMNELLALQPGVIVQDSRVFVRGGRMDEVGYRLEGVDIQNPMQSGPALAVRKESLEEVMVQAGGYAAEYGGGNAGIVQHALRTGTTTPHVSIEYVTDNFTFKGTGERYSGTKVLGAHTYGFTEVTATGSGPLFSEALKAFASINYHYTLDENPRAWPGISLGVIKDPFTRDSINLTYPAGPLRDQGSRVYTAVATLRLDLDNMSIRMTGTAVNTVNRGGGVPLSILLASARSTLFTNWRGVATLKLTHFLSPDLFYELTAGYMALSGKGTDPVLGDNYRAYGDSVANAEAGFIWYRQPAEQLGRYAVPRQLNVFGFAFAPPWAPHSGYYLSEFRRYSAGMALTMRLGSHHTLKAGGELLGHTIRSYSLWAPAVAGAIHTNNGIRPLATVFRSLNTVFIGYDEFGNVTNEDRIITGPRHPVFAGAYIQDRIEYDDLVVNAGVRLDFIDLDDDVMIDPYRPERSYDRNTLEFIQTGWRKAATSLLVSPRFGVAFPVSERTAFHAQVSHYVQAPRLGEVYTGFYGVELRPTQTTQYEIGFRQQLTDHVALDLVAFSRDTRDQIVGDFLYTIPGPGGYEIFRNGDFSTIKGVEFSVTMRRYARFLASGSLALQDAQGSSSFPQNGLAYTYPVTGAPGEFFPRGTAPLCYTNAVRGVLLLDYRYGLAEGGPVMSGLGVSATTTFSSGHPYTRGEGDAFAEKFVYLRTPVEALNSSTTPWTFQLDLRLDKTVSLSDRLRLTAFVEVLNLLDTRNVTNVFLKTGSPDDDGFLSDPELGGKAIALYGPPFIPFYRAINIDYASEYRSVGGYYYNDRYMYGPPRQIRCGFRLEY